MSLDIPSGWTAGHELVPQTIGESVASVFRAGDRFIKSEPIGPFVELCDEVARLRWLRTTGMPCPEVIDATEHAGRHWLLMTALPGRDLASSPHLPRETAVSIAASALRALHALDPAMCPFDHRRARRVAVATAHYRAGLYGGDDPRDADADFAAVLSRQPPGAEDLVVTHGDACFPNFMADGDRFTGFIDCGRLGVADRYQDIALACGSCERNFGAALVPVFLAAYGISKPDAGKLAWYSLLDNFF